MGNIECWDMKVQKVKIISGSECFKVTALANSPIR